MEGSSKKATSRLPTFSGKKADYQVWWMRLKAYATVHGFSTALTNLQDPDLPSDENATIDETTDAGEKAKKALARNAMAIASFSMTFQEDDDLLLITESMSVDWPTGRAWYIVQALECIYRRVDLMVKAKMRQDLNKIKMTNGMNPKRLKKKIAQVENKYNMILPDDERIAIAIKKAAPMYNTILAAEQRAKGSSFNQLTCLMQC
ncbi:hypothetical protein ACA910_008498 [Epithemia clementina (nom. ined.)]